MQGRKQRAVGVFTASGSDGALSSLVRVKGDSMKDAGMLDGAIAIVEHNSPYGPGDVVVAVADGGLTAWRASHTRS